MGQEMKAIVTGAAGFLGFHLSEMLLSRGYEVLGIDNFVSGQRKNISDLEAISSKFKFLESDIVSLSNPSLTQFNGVSRIYHMACPASPPTYQKNPLHTLDTCYLGSRNLLEIAKTVHARILIASTSEIYGDSEVHPQPESYRGNVNTMGPRSCYDEGKRVMETLGHIYSEVGVAVRIVRIFNTYGPRMSPHDGRVVTNFIRQALGCEDLTIYGDGKQTRSFCFYTDLIRGLDLLMESNVIDPVNIGTTFEFTIGELAEIVRKEVNPAVGIKYFPLPIDDPKQRKPIIDRAKKLLNWEPKVDLITGIRELAEDFKKQLK